MPPSVTMSEGTPNMMTCASMNVTSMPTATAARMPTGNGIPWMTTTVPATAAHTPDSAADDRSISPTRSTKTTPRDRIAVVTICRVRFVRLPKLR